MAKCNITNLKSSIYHIDHISQRKLEIKFGCERTHISKTIKKKTYIKKISKLNIPKQTEAQIIKKNRVSPDVQNLPEY